MFVDKVKVIIQAGDGGNGIVSFRHEKFIDRGGPDGGDGGNGGDVIAVASRNQNTLANFRYQKLLKADSGHNGQKRKKHGKSAQDLLVSVPVGTVVFNADGELLADLTEDGQQAVLATGGHGGFGNAHFTSSTRQAPRLAEKGEKGEYLEATFELKMIADVGLVGLPNAGKSTLLAHVSNAAPEIANYPFTTIRPNLGVVDIDESTSLLFADIPGLIEGASKGKGLGDEFLRHVERTAVLVHLIDAYQEDLIAAYKTIQTELKEYATDLSKRPQIVVLNKVDGLDTEMIQARLKELQPALAKGTKLFAISAQSGQGIKELLYTIKDIVAKAHAKRAKEREAQIPVIRLPENNNEWRVMKRDDYFLVVGGKIERFAARTDFSNSHGRERLRDIMQKMGIQNELVRLGIEPEMKIVVGEPTIGTLTY
jgi:GTPase